MAGSTFLVKWIGERDFGFYRTLGQTFDRTLMEKGDYYFCHDLETSDHFQTYEDAQSVLDFLKAKNPDYDLSIMQSEVNA